MRKNALALSFGLFFTAFALMGCFDGPSAPAQEEEALAKAAATTSFITFSIPKRTNNPRNDGLARAWSLCRSRLPRTRVVTLISATRFGNARAEFWTQRWTCRD